MTDPCEKPPWEVPQPMNVYPVTTENVTGEVPDSPRAAIEDVTSPCGTLTDKTALEGPRAVIVAVGDPIGVITVIEG